MAQRWRCAIRGTNDCGSHSSSSPLSEQIYDSGCWASVQNCSVFEIDGPFSLFGNGVRKQKAKNKDEPWWDRTQTCCRLKKRQSEGVSGKSLYASVDLRRVVCYADLAVAKSPLRSKPELCGGMLLGENCAACSHTTLFKLG
jgi:hypothetical protein